jgi:hypothetical protein
MKGKREKTWPATLSRRGVCIAGFDSIEGAVYGLASLDVTAPDLQRTLAGVPNAQDGWKDVQLNYQQRKS